MTALVTKAELALLLAELAPMRVILDRQRGRYVMLGRPELTFVPGKGLRLRGDARIAWDVAGISVPVTLQGWQLLLLPKIHAEDGARLLAFEPVIEELDLKMVPAFLDGKIADAVSEWIAKNRTRIAWNFARTLSRRLPLTKRIAPAEIFEIRATAGEVEVTESELRLTVSFEAHVERMARATEQATERTNEEVPPARPARRAPRHATR